MKTRTEYQTEKKRLKVPKVEEFTISFTDGVSERLKVRICKLVMNSKDVQIRYAGSVSALILTLLRGSGIGRDVSTVSLSMSILCLRYQLRSFSTGIGSVLAIG